MTKQNKNIREPYDPEATPKPPQIIDPNSKEKKENPIENKSSSEDSKRSDSKKPAEPAHRQHLLSDDADIDDETTV